MDSEQKTRITQEILKKSVELLKPLANDVNGINSDEQRRCIRTINDALFLVAADTFGNVTSLFDLSVALNRLLALNKLNDWNIGYYKPEDN